MKMKAHLYYWAVFAASLVGWQVTWAQNLLYPSRFDLHDITLLDSPFKKAQDLNQSHLLDYDVDRMLTPYLRQSGLSSTDKADSPYYQWESDHPAFESFAWNPALAMDGHILGHYLSALSISYQSCQDEVMRAQYKKRIDYIVRVLKDCQDAFDSDREGLKGYLGGIPDNSIWTSLHEADYRTYNKRGAWAPFYCVHKVMAGLRDAYVYTGSVMACDVYRKMCDWAIEIVSLFSGDVMEMQILQWETGGMNEVLADAAQIFDDNKYIKAAQKYSHQIVIENMNADPTHKFLDKKQANGLAAMFGGVARIDQVKSNKRYRSSARLFWDDVVERRMTAIGGVGVDQCFVPAKEGQSHITNADGPDFCTTYNMLKLTETMFTDTREARYAEYYERALLNHVLASIDPATGGYTYFTSLRPGSYKIYSTPNESMWCCVGTGMESHSKYGEFIYTMTEDTLFVNLFIASELNNHLVSLVQETDFPYGTTSKITIRKSGSYQLAVRHPGWAGAAFCVKRNGKVLNFRDQGPVIPGTPCYLSCGRSWHAGDVIEISYPMELNIESCPNYHDYVALRYGPCLLAGQTSSNVPGDSLYQVLPHEYGGEGMRDHSPKSRAELTDLVNAPMFICEAQDVAKRVKAKDLSKLLFTADASAAGSRWGSVLVKPFFDIHHTRYSIYWNRQTEANWMRNPLFKNNLRKREIEALTFDQVTPGDNASERAHNLKVSSTGSRGNLNGRTFRDAQPDQWFEYTLNIEKLADSPESSVALLFDLSVIDKGRSGIVSVNGTELERFTVSGIKPKSGGKDKFYEQAFEVPADFVKGKRSLVVRISSDDGSYVPRIYQIRVVKNDKRILN